MCPPEHFAVEYAINPWMDVTAPVDTGLARQAVGAACATRCSELGHEVHVLDPAARPAGHGLRGQRRVLGRRRRSTAPGSATRSGPPRPPRTGAFYASGTAGTSSRRATINEGEGDFAYLPERVRRADPRRARLPHRVRRRTPRRRRCWAGRWSRCAWSTRASTTWTWRWPSLDDRTIAYYPGAFSRGRRSGCSPSCSRTRCSPTRRTPWPSG